MSVTWRMWLEQNIVCICVDLSAHTAKITVAVGKSTLFSENDFIENRAKEPVFPSPESSTSGVFQHENFHPCCILFSFPLFSVALAWSYCGQRMLADGVSSWSS